MEPMKPMQPMKPMAPMKGQGPWWSEDLGEPNTSGSEDDLKYAYFADRHRLAVSRAGRVTVYDTGEHEITGVSQHQSGEDGNVNFASPHGDVALRSLDVVD